MINLLRQEGQIRACDGHPEAELAFVRLYEVTGKIEYLEQAEFQLKTRGSEPYYYDIEWERKKKVFIPIYRERNQVMTGGTISQSVY